MYTVTVDDDPAGPVSGWRLRLYQVCWLIAVGLSRTYFPGRVEGREYLPAEGPYVLAPVHRSYVDWLVVARVTRRRLRYMAKAELWKVKSVGHFFELLGAFPVHRAAADREAFKRAEAVLAGGEPLVLFPEGTRQHGAVVQPLRDGATYLALRAGVPIVPVGIGGTERRMPKGSSFPRPGRVHIVIGAPILPADFARTGSESSPGDAVPGRQRVSRAAARKMSTELQEAVQGCFDSAQARLGLAGES
jgi:1-acyl-sn-glycerol-3-phosphate acyltransferase